jgi:hypothetical protein
MSRKAAKPAKNVRAYVKRRAERMARPLYTRPGDLKAMKQNIALHAEHIATQNAMRHKNEYDRLTGLIHSVQPGLQGHLLAERSKLI